MQVKVFVGNPDTIEEKINCWLDQQNEEIEVRHVCQTETVDSEGWLVTISLWYEEK